MHVLLSGKESGCFLVANCERENVVVPPRGCCAVYCRVMEAMSSMELQIKVLTNFSTRTAHCLKFGSREMGSKAPSVTRLELVSEK